MNKKDYVLRILVITLAFIFPFICISHEGSLESISQYWNTPLKPLLITSNAATAYFLFSLDRWKLSSILLLLLTAFSITDYPLLHNIFAYGFFIACIYPLYCNTRLKLYLVPYSCSLFLAPLGFLYIEIVCVCTLCMFHSHLLYLKWNVDFNRKIIQKELTE